MRSSDIPGLNLRKLPLSFTSHRNFSALLNRPFLQDDYTFRDIKPQHESFIEYRKKYSYSGIVNVDVYGVDSLLMYSDNDDSVAITYFYFGPNAYETLSVALFAHFASLSRTVLDVGAFTGLYSLVAAKGNSHAEIHAFEPIELTADRTIFNAKINGLKNIRIHKFAISDREKTAEFIIYGCSEASTGNSFYRKPNQNILKTIDVPVKSLDDVFPDDTSIDLIKIDTEFDEYNALLGASNILRNARPVIFAEVLDNESLNNLIAFLEPYGYQTAYLSETTIELVSIEKSSPKTPVQQYGYGNLVFFPDEKSMNIAQAFTKNLSDELRANPVSAVEAAV